MFQKQGKSRFTLKIIDYGLWFSDYDNIWVKVPMNRHTSWIYIDGFWVGYGSGIDGYSINMEYLKLARRTVKLGAPGRYSSGKVYVYWDFPLNYIPTESDFEEIP